MSQFHNLNPVAGTRPMAQFYATDTVLDENMGTTVLAVDPYYGGAEFIFCFFPSVVNEKQLVALTPTFDSTNSRWRINATAVANTANLAQPLGVAFMPTTAVNSYGWVQIGGITQVNSSAAVAADTSFGIAAAGQAGAVAAGKQVLNARVVGASSTTVVKVSQGSVNGIGVTGDNRVLLNNCEGLFVGGYISGTGLAAANKITAIDISEKMITVSVVHTATVTGNVTMTPNNGTIFYNTVFLNRPFAQGAIT
jgi:hypothetical protein